MERQQTRMYTRHSEWWPLLSRVEDYEEEARLFRDIILSRAPGTRTVLELGSGGGHNAFFLKRTFDMTLVDLSPGMLAVSQKLNPDCEHLEGDMRSVRLGRTFDAVFIHDAISYMVTRDDLRRALETAAVHLGGGGVLLATPDHFRETFRPSTSHGGHDSGGRGMRYLQWTHEPAPGGHTYSTWFAYMFRHPDGRVETDCEEHTCGLFAGDTWLEILRECGLDAEVCALNHSELDEGSWNALVGRKA